MESALLPSCEATIQGRNIKEPLYEEVKVTGAVEDTLTFYITRPVPDDRSTDVGTSTTAAVVSTHSKNSITCKVLDHSFHTYV